MNQLQEIMNKIVEFDSDLGYYTCLNEKNRIKEFKQQLKNKYSVLDNVDKFETDNTIRIQTNRDYGFNYEEIESIYRIITVVSTYYDALKQFKQWSIKVNQNNFDIIEIHFSTVEDKILFKLVV